MNNVTEPEPISCMLNYSFLHFLQITTKVFFTSCSEVKEIMTANQTMEFDNWCKNKAGESVTSNYCWTIEKFLDRKQNEKIESHKFEISGPDDENTFWSLYSIPKPSEEPNAVSLFLTNAGKNEVKASFELSIIDKTNKKKKTLRSIETRTFGKAWGFKNFIEAF